MREFSIFDAAKVIGKDHTAIREWFKFDYIPLNREQKAQGRGTKTVLYTEDLYRLKAFEILLNAGIKREYAASYINYLHEKNPKRPKEFNWEGYHLRYLKSHDGVIQMALDSDKELKQHFREQAKNIQNRIFIETIINLRTVKDLVDKNIP